MLPVNSGGHAAYQNFVVTNLRKYYPNPDSISRATWDIIFIESKRLYTEELLIRILGRKPSVCKSCGFDGNVRTGLAPPVTV